MKKSKFISINSTKCDGYIRVDVVLDGLPPFGVDMSPNVTAEGAAICLSTLCCELLIRDGAEPGQFPKFGV